MTEWKKFSEEWPKCDWIWFFDGVKVYLKPKFVLNEPKDLAICTEDFMWAEANIEYPSIPEKKRHFCKSDDPDNSYCEEQNGELFFHHWGSLTNTLKFRFCPFCGWSKDKDD